MFIKKLVLKNFRNYTALDIEFSPGINFIVGPNGTGKTNILEGISIASGIRSFRNVPDHEIIQWGYQSYYCHVTAGNGEPADFEVGCADVSGRIKKRAKIDGAEIHRVSDYFGKLLTVIFAPADINIINGTPDLRRRFFDRIISQVDVLYLKSLADYKRILVSRNSLLKQFRERRSFGGGDLDVWDDMLAEKSSLIMRRRGEFLKAFSPFFREAYESIAENDETPTLTYERSAGGDEVGSLLTELKNGRSRDLAMGATRIGPHRDDFGFVYGSGRIFRNAASQGQRRTAAIALKSAERSFIEEATNKKVVVMVDDIFSELDETRRENMVQILKRDNQVLFTMVDGRLIETERFGECARFSVSENGVTRES